MKPDDKTLMAQIARMASAGMVVPVDPDDAELMAAFEDDALPLEEALASRFDDVAEGGE